MLLLPPMNVAVPSLARAFSDKSLGTFDSISYEVYRQRTISDRLEARGCGGNGGGGSGGAQRRIDTSPSQRTDTSPS